MLNIVLFGPPGAGKGTQSEKLIAKYGLVHISTGDLLRAERSAGTQLGKEANTYIEKGELVPDTVVIGMVKNKIESHKNAPGFIFDGFPRTIAQGEALDKLLAENNQTISVMLSLEVEEDELVARLLNRGKTSGRADDQNEETIRNRFQVYSAETTPLKSYYAAQGKLKPVDGLGSIDDIFNRLCRAIEN